MPRIKLVLEYDGTAYVGWQVQDNGPSLQAVIERALCSLLKVPTPTMVAGRTDAGVHAEGQVVAFDAREVLPMTAYLRGLNGLLPEDMAVVAAQEVAPEFDPRRWTRGKHYRYRISNRGTRAPLARRFMWEVFPPLDAEAMQRAAAILLGTHDFSAFRASTCTSPTPIRRLTQIAVHARAGHEIEFNFEGTAFLHHMIRNIVGSLVEVGRGHATLQWLGDVLESRDRTRAGPTAPPHGLSLVEVFYAPAGVHGRGDSSGIPTS